MFKKLFGKQDEPGSLVPLDKIAESIEISVVDVKRTPSGLTFRSDLGETSVSISPRHIKCVDGAEVSEIVSIKTVLPEKLSFIDKSQIAFFNTVAALSALMIDEKSGQVSVASRLSVYKDYEQTWRLFGPLVSYSAILQADSVLGVFRQAFAQEQQTEEGEITESNDPSRWTEKEFEHAHAMLESMGVFANDSPDGLTAEFPWEPGGFSAVAGHQTSLMMLQANMPHPVLGNGLFFKLELPLQFEETEVVDLSNRMNFAELNAIDSPPFFGAWCTKKESGRLAFVGFWPNLLYQPGTAQNIASWLMHRSQISKAMLNSMKNG